MIITPEYFYNCGIPTSTDIDRNEVNFAIDTVTHTIIYDYLGAEKLNDIIENPETEENILIINGNGAFPGLRLALVHLVFAYLLFDRIRLTRYSSVVKDDEHSKDPDYKDIYSVAQMHFETGMVFLRRIVVDAMHKELPATQNGFIFGELFMF